MSQPLSEPQSSICRPSEITQKSQCSLAFTEDESMPRHASQETSKLFLTDPDDINRTKSEKTEQHNAFKESEEEKFRRRSMIVEGQKYDNYVANQVLFEKTPNNTPIPPSSIVPNQEIPARQMQSNTLSTRAISQSSMLTDKDEMMDKMSRKISSTSFQSVEPPHHLPSTTAPSGNLSRISNYSIRKSLKKHPIYSPRPSFTSSAREFHVHQGSLSRGESLYSTQQKVGPHGLYTPDMFSHGCGYSYAHFDSASNFTEVTRTMSRPYLLDGESHCGTLDSRGKYSHKFDESSMPMFSHPSYILEEDLYDEIHREYIQTHGRPIGRGGKLC